MDTHCHHDASLLPPEEVVAQLKADFDGAVFEQLLHQFRPLVRSCCLASKSRYLDFADYMQEARMTLWHAVKTYQGGIPFKSYFKIILIRHLSHLHRYELASKRFLGADCVSLDVDNYVREQLEGQFDPLSPLAQPHACEPEAWYLAKANTEGYFASLSDWEMEVLLACLDGMTVEEMALAKGKSVRSCQSALSRCRKKLEDFSRKA